MPILDTPLPWQGTPEEAAANRETHWWLDAGEEPPRCGRCDAAAYHVAADYPCGTEPPRVVRVVGP